jgi:hypothetical protein
MTDPQPLTAPRLLRAVPNENFEFVLEFAGGDYRLFKANTLWRERGWPQLAYPQHLKRFALTPNAIAWPEGGRIDAGTLHAESTPVDGPRLQHHLLRLSYKNQAPTSEDASHHVYGVYLAPFAAECFSIGESIGGGHGERGGGRAYTLPELLAWPGWRRHFELAGCRWAIAVVESLAAAPDQLMDTLVAEACRRNGTAEEAPAGP